MGILHLCYEVETGKAAVFLTNLVYHDAVILWWLSWLTCVNHLFSSTIDSYIKNIYTRTTVKQVNGGWMKQNNSSNKTYTALGCVISMLINIKRKPDRCQLRHRHFFTVRLPHWMSLAFICNALNEVIPHVQIIGCLMLLSKTYLIFIKPMIRLSYIIFDKC